MGQTVETKGKKNAYTCGNLHSIVTIYKDSGTTPMFMGCPKCGTKMVSRMGDINPNAEPTHEWYKPTEADWKEVELAIDNDTINALKEHVRKGGLLYRQLTTNIYNSTLEM